MDTDDPHSSSVSDPDHTEAATAQLADPAEIERLHQEYSAPLLTFLVNRTHNRSHAEDLSQDFWLKLHTRLHQFDGKNFRAWAFQILRRQIIDSARKKKPDAMPESVEPLTPAPIDDDREEKSRALHACINELPDPSKSLVVAWLAGQDYREMSEAQQLSAGTVASRLNRAKKQLADCVKGRMS